MASEVEKTLITKQQEMEEEEEEEEEEERGGTGSLLANLTTSQHSFTSRDKTDIEQLQRM